MEETIKDFYGKVIGFIETKPNGDKLAKDFYRRVLGTYEKKFNITKDFYGRVIGRGDLTSGLIWNKYNKDKKNVK